MRLSPILKYQLAIDIQVISTVGGAASAGVAQAADSASAALAIRRFFSGRFFVIVESPSVVQQRRA